MKKTDVDFMLALANLIDKLESGGDYTAECTQIRNMPEEKQESIVRQLLARVSETSSKEEERAVQAVHEIGFLDREYVEDLVQVMHLRAAGKTVQDKKELVCHVLSREQPYGRTMMEDIFWSNLTMIAINTKDHELLTRFIRKIEELRDGLEEE